MTIKLMADIDLCIGCFSCETACKQEHKLPRGPRWMKVVEVGPTEIDGRLIMDFVPMHCRHCGSPPCMAACPVEAISKRNDGIVIFSENRCIGCGECAEACPFGAPQYHPEKEIFQACNLCFERIDQGLKPACVQHCPTEALIFGDPNALSNRLREKKATPLLHRRFTESANAG